MDSKGVFDTSIKAWLAAMQKAKKIQPGGKLVFVNRKTRAALPTKDAIEGIPQ